MDTFMSLSANILKKMLDLPKKIRHLIISSVQFSSVQFSSVQFSSVQSPEVRPHSVKFNKALLLFYAGRSPPLRHKESVRRFLFPECNHLIKLVSEAFFCRQIRSAKIKRSVFLRFAGRGCKPRPA